MITEDIISKFGLCNRKINNVIGDIIADEFIAGYSYGGMTPRQAIESFASRIQTELDLFFNN